ncbi:MAG: UMP kinase [Candidatus Brocadiae bacterium]|nr:UMP kinase [Candidatus Brocadiia bacterium]
MTAARYRRILLKVSGEGLCASGNKGLDIDEIDSLAREVLSAQAAGAQVAVVVGGGNIVRGAELSKRGVTPATADYMGMLATVINSLALQDMLEKHGAQVRVATAISVHSVAEPYVRRRVLSHLEKGRIVILAAGTGNPHVTTDTAAALRATELGCEVILKATKVDGVYTGDPKKDPSATRYEKLSYMDVLNQRLKVMDSMAISMCMEYHIPIIVFDLKRDGNIARVVRGEQIGTTITG